MDKLVVRAQKGDKAAENQLFRSLRVRLHRFVKHKIQNEDDVQDLVQEVCQTVAEKYMAEDFHTSFYAWAYEITKNKLGNYFMREARLSGRVKQLEEESEEVAVRSPNFELKLTTMECLELIARQNKRFIDILHLRIMGESDEEVCGRLRISLGNLRTIRSRGLSQLEKCVDAGGVAT